MKILKTSLFLSLLLLAFSAFAQTDCSDNTEIYQVTNSSQILCNGDGTPNVIRFRTLPLALPTAYFVVDENDTIVYIGYSSFIDFEPLPTGQLRVFSVGVVGSLLAEVGDNYLETDFGYGCYVISDNFVPIRNLRPDGGTVSTVAGETAITLCVNEDVVNIEQFQTTSPDEDYIYLVTDEDNVLLSISTDGSVDFSGAAAGICRVWGLSLFDEFTGEPGQSASVLLANNPCADLSDNFVEVTRLTPEGGAISYTDGSTEFVSCSVLQPSGSVSLQVVGNSTSVDFTYVLVDATTNIVSAIFSNPIIDLAELTVGSYQIYGLSYTGNLMVATGMTFDADNLSDECADLSDAPLSLIKRVQNADDVLLESGADEATVCVGDGLADPLTFTSTYQGGDNLIYIITNPGSFVQNISTTNVIDFDGIEPGIWRVWTAVYSGNLTLEIGQNLGTSPVSDECYDLSDGFVLINANGPEGGQIAYSDGSTAFISCTSTGPSGLLTTSVTNNDLNSDYTYILVDSETNTIVGFYPMGEIELAELANGSYQLYGFSFLGDLTANPGDSFEASALTNQCGDLSDNSLTLIRRVQLVESVSLEDGSSSATVCIGDGVPDPLTFTTSYSGDDTFIYVITDEANEVLDTSADATIDFEGADPGICRVWGLAYSGNLTVSAGDVITPESQLSDECFALSPSYVTINRNGPDGGSLLWETGETVFLSCTPVEPMGELTAEVEGNDPNSTFTFIVVDEDNTIIAIQSNATFSLSTLPLGPSVVYGLSYQGELTIAEGDTFVASSLSTSCNDLSDNALTVIKRIQHADDVFLADGSTEVTICVGDGIPDLLTFESNTTSVDSLVFLITDESNVLLDISSSNTIDFEGAEEGICRVWAMVFTGDILLEPGDMVRADNQLASECADLSDGFVSVNRNGPEGGSITFADGTTSYQECQATTGASLELTASGIAPNLSYAYIVVNREDGMIAAILTGTTLDLSSLPLGTYDVYGLSYLGNLTVAVGDMFGNAALADDCFDLSDNTLSITNRSVSVNMITLVNGNTTAAICPNDGTPDVLSFTTDYSGSDNLAFLVTDEDNMVLRILAAPSSDFDTDGPALIRIWAVAYSGNFLLQPGNTITADTDISDDCFDLSDNFVLIDRNGPNGGMVSLPDGSTEVSTCTGDELADVLEVSTTGVGAEYIYVVTDEDNNILSVSTSPEIDFEGAPAGVCRIWGLGYGGNLLAMEGDNAAEVELADGCFSLSDNFITVTRVAVDGGMVSLTDGTTQTFACGGDGEADFFEFTSVSSATDASYGYVITDADNNILAILEGNAVNLDEAAPGICRVWGLSYTGEIIADIGENAAEVALTDACFELSGNFVTINRQRVDGGNVTLEDGSSLINICPNDNFEDILTFVNDGSTTAAYSYAITDTDNNLLNYFQGDSFDFNAAILPSEIRIYGVAFSGLRSSAEGNILTTVLSNQCYDVSDTYVTVIREETTGGNVSTDEGASMLTLCTDDGLADLFTFMRTGAGNTPYVYLVTDAANNILEVLENTNSFDFEGAPAGECRVWGLAYTGELLATVGTNAATTALSDDCFALSDNYITVNRGSFEAGTINTIWLVDDYSTCPGDGEDDPVSLLREGNAGHNATFVYLLTDAEGKLLGAFNQDEFSFEDQAEGVYRIYSFAYSGEFPLTEGDDLTLLDLSDSCADLSDNYVTVNNFPPVAGTITANGGLSEVSICAGDGNPDIVNLEPTGAGNASYVFLVIDEDDIIVGLLDNPTFDFDNASPGDWRIYGMSYSGSLLAFPGGTLMDELASSCYELTDTSVFLHKTYVDGGQVFTDGGQQVVYGCEDDIADIVNFVNSSNASENYRYLLTDANNILLSVLTGNSVDLESAAGLGNIRIWGASFAGELALNVPDIITENAISDACGVLSDNYVDIYIGMPEGGILSLADGSTSGRLCHGNSRPGVFVQTSSSSNVGYAYLLTDEDNNVLAISEDPDGLVSFDEVAPGTYRIWAVSYTGSLLVEMGDNAAETELASSCYELSENFLTIERTESLDAGNVSTIEGSDEVYFCPGDGNPDLLVFENDSEEPNYRYLLTDTMGNILITDIETNVINFDIAPPGVCRLYGIAYTGTFDAPSDGNIFTDALSTDCWMLSNNYILIVKQQPEGGMVSTIDGETEIEVTVGDGSADVYQFTNTGIELTPYTYVITDEDNIIIGLSADGEIDFEGATPGICRVWGLSYVGNLLVGMGDDAANSILSDDCYDLSDNFVTVTRTAEEGFQPEDDEEWETQWTDNDAIVLLRPNPVVDVLRIEITVHGEATTAAQRLDVFDVNGLLVSSMQVAPVTETQTTSLDVSQLQAGLYLLRWQNGEEVVVKRFIKQN